MVTEITDMQHHVKDWWKEPPPLSFPYPIVTYLALHCVKGVPSHPLRLPGWREWFDCKQVSFIPLRWGVRKRIHREAGKDLSEGQEALI